MRLLLLGLLQVFFFSSLLAQEEIADDEQLKYMWPKFAIGISPSSYFNTTSAVQLSFDISLLRNINFTTEAGYILYTVYNRPTSGFRVVSGFEFLFARYQRTGWYLGLYAHIRYTEDQDVHTIFYENYFQEIPFNRTKKFIAPKVMVGFAYALNDRFEFQLSGGAGVGELTVEDDVEINRNEFFNNSFFETDNVYPFFNFNANFTYNFGIAKRY